MTAEDIRARIAELIGENGQLRAILKRIAEGRAGFSDTMQYAIVSGRIMGKELSSVILELAEGRPEIARQLLLDRYDDINDLCDQVQTALDAKQGLHLRPQKAPFPAERVKQITDSLTDPTASDDTIRRRARSSANIAASFHDDYIKANADFRSKSGLQCYITRETDGKCCPWCTDLAGHYRYPEDIPESIFQRHDNCGCTVTYENGRQRQNVWTKQNWEAPEKEAGADPPKVFSREEALRLQAEHMPRVLTGGTENGIIISKENLQKITDSMPNASDADEFVTLVNNCKNEDIKRAYRDCLNQVDKVEYNSERGGESYYRHSQDKLVYSYPIESDIIKGESKFSSVTHEIGHLIDYKGVFDNLTFSESDALNTSIHTSFTFKRSPSGSDQFLEAVRKDKANLAKIVMKSDVRQDLFSTISSGGVQDALDGMFGAKVKMRYGHGEAYYNETYNRIKKLKNEKKIQEAYKQLGFDASNQAKVRSLVRCHTVASEVWANITSAETCGGADLDFFKKYLPNSYDSFISIMKGLR